MKDSIFSWHRILALCILLVHVTMMVPAQELYLGRQLGTQYLEHYLDRADLESSQQRWQELADQGMLVALAAWESAQTYLLEQDPQLWQSERAALERELVQETEVRLAQWLLDKYIQSQSNPKFQQLATELQQRSSQWEYEYTDGAGSVVATRQVEASNGQEAKDQWLMSNQQLIQQYVEENSLDTGLLESQLQELDLDEATRRTLVQEAASSYQAYLATEYDLILRSETMDLMGNLLYDRESLRAVSAKESADAIALTLIQEAKASTEISVKELFQDFQEDVNQNQLEEGQIHVDGEQWAQEFQRQLEEGLAVWDKMEVDFLSHRSQWEQEALETYEVGEEAWLAAFQKLKSARQEWENEIMAEFQQGMEEWNQSRLEQELEIEAAQEELLLSMQEEIQQKKELALFAVTVYDQVRSLLASCYQGVENWYSNWAQKYNKVYSYWKTEDNVKYKALFSHGTIEGLAEFLATSSDAEGEIDLHYLSASDTRNKIETQISQWKGAYLEHIKNEAEKEILQLESEIARKEADLERLQDSTSSDEVSSYSSQVNMSNAVNSDGVSSYSSQVIMSNTVNSDGKTEKQRIQEQLDALSENKASLERLLVEMEQVDVSMSGEQIASHLNKAVPTSLLKVDFDARLWDSSETLLQQDTGWLVLADAGFENLETATNNFFEAVDPTSLEGSSSDLDAEIQRLEGTLSYWQDELAVAQALKDYATTTTSSAETAQETQQELEACQQALQQADEDYKNHQQLVQESYGAIQQAMIHLSEIKVQLDEAGGRVEEIKNQIIALDEVIKGLDKEVIEAQIIKILDSLRKSFSQEDNQKNNGLVESFFQQATIEGNQVYTGTIEELLKTTPLEGASSQDELLFRQEVLSYITQGEPEAWQEVAESQEEEQRRQLIRDSYGTIRLDILNEKHRLALQDIKAIVQEKDIWNFTNWEDLTATVKRLYDSGMNLHAGAASALDQLLAVVIQHWCLQNSQTATVSQETASSQESVASPASEASPQIDELAKSTDSPEITLSRSEIQQQITELRAIENGLFDVQKVISFLNSPLFSQLDEEIQGKFMDYVAKQVLGQTNSVEQLPISDGIAFLNQLNDAEYSWKNNFSQLSEEMQLALASKLEKITDIQSLNEDMASLQSILKEKQEVLEESDFFLSLEELKNAYLQDSSQQELNALLENCSKIQKGTLLSEEDWAQIQILFTENGLNELKKQELQSLREQWLAALKSCSEAPYEILSQASLQGSENPASQYLNQIAASLDVSATITSLLEPVEVYALLGSSTQELQKEKEELENQLSGEELKRQDFTNQYEKAAAMVNQTIAAYQTKLEEENNLYEAFLQSRLNLRIAEEKYRWASRIYLESIGSETAQESAEYGSPLQRYNEVLLVTNRYQKALEILMQMKNQQQLKNQEYLLQLEAYENSLEKAYLMEVILSQALTAVAKQEEATRQAELKDDINASKLFASYESLFPSVEGTDTTELAAQGITSPALELIRISRDENNSYYIELGYETNYVKTGTKTSTDAEGNEVEKYVHEYVSSKKDSAGDLDGQLLEAYLTDTTETIVRVDDNLQLTRAEVEVRQWLEEIHAKGDDYLNKLLLASLHLKTYSSIPKTGDESHTDVTDKDVFQADQVPEVRKFHGVNTKSRYNSERQDIVAAAYSSIMGMEGGEEALARYILYRETNLLDKNSWKAREKDLVEWLALDNVREELADKQNQKVVEATIAFSLAAALSVAAGWFQPWLWVAAAAATAAGITATDAAISLGAAKDGIYDLMKGNKENVLKTSESLHELLDNLQEGKDNLQEQWELLNLFYYGDEQEQSLAGGAAPKQALTVESIMASVQEMLNQNQFVSPQEYKSLLTAEFLSSLLEKETNSLDTSSEQGQSLKVTDVLLQSSLHFQTEYWQEGESLSRAAADIQEKSQAAMTGFYQVLGQSLEISEGDREKLVLLEAQATDGSLSTAQRQLAMTEYQSLYQSLFAMDSATQKQLSNLASLAYGSEGWNNLLYKKDVYNSHKSLYNTKVSFASGTEAYTAWLQELMVQQAISSYEDSALQVFGQSQHQWQLERDLLDRRQNLWEAEVLETLAAGEKSWQRVEERLNKEYTLWRRSFQKELEERQEEWEQNYLDFLQKKEAWVQESHRQGLVQGLGQGLVSGTELVSAINQQDLEQQLAYLGRSMESSVTHETTEAVAETLLADSYLDQLISRSSTMAGLGKNTGAGIKKIRRNISSLESQLVAQQQAAKTSRLMTRLAGRQAADHGQELLEQILAGYLEGIDSQNQAMVDWQEYLARDAGYTVDGSIRRTIVVDATLMNPIKETQYLPVYQHYSVTAPKLRNVEATSRESAMLQLGLAQSELELWGRSIFGTDGLLSKHIGVAPTMVGNPDPSGSKKAAFKDMGSGQMGDILVDYYWNSIQARKGMEELSKAGHDKRLFDDRGLPFTAPTLREVSEVAMNIVGTAMGQEWLKYVDDVVFAGIDLGGGYKTAGEIGQELAIKAVGVAIGAGTNWAGDIVGKALAGSGKAVNFLVQGSISGSGAYLSGVASNYIAGGDGGWGDAGNLAVLAGGFVSGGLGGVNLRDGDGIRLSDKVFDVEGISAMNGLAGGLASTAVSFGMTGNATFNLASIKGVGLLEVTLGKDGISGRLGSGGMSLSLETLTAASRGRQEAGKVMDWKYGGEESRSTLNGVNKLGHTDLEMNHRLANGIWDEEIGVNFGDVEGGYGLYKHGENSITLDRSLLGGGIEGSAKLATVLAHEGTHLYGNRVEGAAHLQGAATYMQLLDKFNLAGDKTFAGEIMAGLANSNSWVENTGDEDWWKQVRRNDGSFAWQEDGSLDFTFEDGTEVTAEEMKAFISSYTVRSQARSAGIGVFESNDEVISDTEKAMTKVFSEYLRNTPVVLPTQGVERYAAFVHGTEAFADASIAIQNAMTTIDNREKRIEGYSDQKVTETLTEMFHKLGKVQESGFLEKNKIQISDNLVGQGVDTNPYLPLTGTVSVTSLQGYRFVTQKFYDGLKDNSKANFPLNNFAKNKHIHTDLWALDKSVVTSVDGSIKLNYDSTWGLNGAQFSDNSMRVYLSNHLDSSSLMNYLSIFGMDETRISQLQNGQYSLQGVKAGVIYATMGQTGVSGGAHIDFGIYEVNNKNILSMYRDNNLNFESVYSNVYEKLNMEDDVKAYSGLSSKRWDIDERAKEVRVYMHDVLINSWNDTYKPILEVLQFLN